MWPNLKHLWLAEQCLDVLWFCESLQKKLCCFNCPVSFPYFLLFFLYWVFPLVVELSVTSHVLL